MPGWRVLCCLVTSLTLAHGQAPKDVPFSLFAVTWYTYGLLNQDTRDAFLQSSSLSPEQKRIISDTALEALELGNVEMDVARLRQQRDADFASFERRRGEILQKIAAELERRLGADGWEKFNSFLHSLQPQIRVYRSFCDNRSEVRTLGVTLQSNDSMTAIAVVDTDYHAGGILYARAELRSPENRQVAAESPASSRRIHAAAVALLAVGLEDGTYQGSFRFGESCGGDEMPRIYRDQRN